jgi:competence protein ComEC
VNLARAPVDVRLAIAAGVAWITLAASLGATPTALVVECGCAAAVGLAALTVRRGVLAGAAPALALAGLATVLVMVPFTGRLWLAHDSPLQQLAERQAAVTTELTVADDPHKLAATGPSGMARVAVPTDADTVQAGVQRWSVSGPVLVLAPAVGWSDVLPGQRVRVTGTLQPSLDAGSDGATLFAEQPPQLFGQPPWWQRAAGAVRDDLREAASVLPPEERGLLPGLVDGDTGGLDPVLVERFRIAGLTHLVAVSGTNCSIVIGVVLFLLRRARVRPWLSAAIGGLVLIGFVLVARPSPSVLRAALMAAVALVSLATGRPRQAVPALAATVLALLVWDPQLSADPGFAMSALATAALLLIAPGWLEVLRRWRVPPVLAESVAVAPAAHLVTAPVIAAISGRISLVAIPANVLAEPAVPIVTVLGFAAALVATGWTGGGHALAWLAGWPCRWLVRVADVAGGLPGAAIGWPGGAAGGLALLAAGLTLLVLARRSGGWRLAVIAALVVVLVRIPVNSLATNWPPPNWVFVACDVGQGDALVLPAGPHTAVEIDAGPDPVAIDRCLRDLGISDIALLVFTHYHLDHVGGLAGVLHGRTVREVITGPLAEPAAGVELVHDQLAEHGLDVRTPPVGAAFDVGQVHLEVLGPPAAFHDTRSDPNNSSLVLRARIGDVRILLPGDVEIEAQQAMLADGVDVTADVLKVPHHGSAYSDPDFLAAVHARVGVISVGLHNDYGHPSPVLLDEMAQLGVPVRRTDLDGDVAVTGPSAELATVVRGTAASHALAGGVTGAARITAPDRIMLAGPQPGSLNRASWRRPAPGPRRSSRRRCRSCPLPRRPHHCPYRGRAGPCRTGTARGPPGAPRASGRVVPRRRSRRRTSRARSAPDPSRRRRRR